MASKIEWSLRAEANLENIFDYISKDSILYASRFVTNLVQHTENELIHYPLIGRKIPEFENTPLNFLREIIFKGYRVIYHHNIELKRITVVNGRMNIPESMGLEK